MLGGEGCVCVFVCVCVCGGGGGGVSHPLQLATGLVVNQFPPWQVSICFLFLGKY